MQTKEGALEGIKVADFSWAGVGPITAKLLADFGATVVHIESHTKLDIVRLVTPFKGGKPGINTSTLFTNYNSSKYGATLNLNKEKGREIAMKFIKWSDIVLESFTPDVMKRWNLDYESVSKVKPDIIYFSTTQMGQGGPYSRMRGFGPLSTPNAGLVDIQGWPDRPPTTFYGAYTDYFSPNFAATTILAALDYRARTGKGTYIEQAQFETGVQFVSEHVMDYMINGRLTERSGNQLPYAAPHGVFKCKGDDRWVAIAVFTDEDWQAFCRRVGKSEWINDSRFCTLLKRKENENELNRLIEQWTVEYTAEQVECMMQNDNIAASVVESNQDLFEDPQLAYRNHFTYLDHEEIGVYACDSPTCKLSETPAKQFAAPCLGEHNQYVYMDLLGLSSDEVSDLIAEGVITTEVDLKDFTELH